MNNNVLLSDVRSQAMDIIQRIKHGEIKIEEAKTINGLLNTIVETAKTEVNMLNALPKAVKDKLEFASVRILASSMVNTDIEVEETMKELEENNKKPYQFGK